MLNDSQISKSCLKFSQNIFLLNIVVSRKKTMESLGNVNRENVSHLIPSSNKHFQNKRPKLLLQV